MSGEKGKAHFFCSVLPLTFVTFDTVNKISDDCAIGNDATACADWISYARTMIPLLPILMKPSTCVALQAP